MGDKLVSGSELARQTGVTKQSISKAVRRGTLIPDSFTKVGRPQFLLEKNKKIILENAVFNEDQSRHEGLPQELKGGRPRLSPVDKNTGDKTSDDDDIDDEKLNDNARFLKAKIERAETQSELAKIDLEKARGLLVSVDEINQQGAELGTVLIGSLTALPDRLAPELSTMSDQHEIHKLLTDEINSLIVDIREKLSLGETE